MNSGRKSRHPILGYKIKEALQIFHSWEPATIENKKHQDDTQNLSELKIFELFKAPLELSWEFIEILIETAPIRIVSPIPCP